MHSFSISYYWCTFFIYRSTQKITFHYSRIQYLCPCLPFLIVVVNINIIFIWWFTWKPIKAQNFNIISKEIFPFFSKTIILSSFSALRGVLFVVVWLRLPGTCHCILRLLREIPSHEVPESFTLLSYFSLTVWHSFEELWIFGSTTTSNVIKTPSLGDCQPKPGTHLSPILF